MLLGEFYDAVHLSLEPQTYVFKLMNSSGVTESGESEKVLLLMESGVRLHTTAYVRDKSNTPSGFTLKLRKHIRTRRIEDVRQLGYDRDGVLGQAHTGDDDKGFAIMSRHQYPVEICRVFERTTIVKLQAALMSLEEVDNSDNTENNEGGISDPGAKGKQGNRKGWKLLESNKTSNDSARAKQTTLKVFLGEALGYGPQLSEHIILDTGLLPNTKVGRDFKLDDATVQVLDEAVAKFEDWLEDIISGDRIPEGYILMQQKNLGKKEYITSEAGSSDKIYDEFCPLLLNQFKSRDSVKFETFDAALDEFYSFDNSIAPSANWQAKMEENRVHTLKKEVDRCIKMAELIEYNLEDVDAAILAVRVALANGMSWEDLARMVKEEKKSGNPVEVDLALSAHANARRWYEQKKKQESKQEKTISAHEKAFKAAERKTQLQLSQEKTVAAISHMRKVHWFEKFNWSISSENYLIISGRDAQQNEMIVKRYMSKGDLYIHADLHGASSTVIKNHKPEHPIPPLTLNQAGCFTVCHSQAWDSKIVTSAWWVYPLQVSKTAPTGEYLTVGSFMIRGKKNFLPPHPLIMGFGILFRLDESSLGSHLNERRVRGDEERINDTEETGFLKEISDSDSENEITDEKHSLESQRIIDSSTDHGELISGGLSLDISSGNGLSCSDFKAISLDEVAIDDRKTLNGADNEKRTKIAGEGVASVSPQLEDILDRALELGAAAASGKSYGLHASQVYSAEDRYREEDRPAVREKPYISKAERRKLKKGQKSSTMVTTVEHEKEEEEDNSATASQCDKDVQNLKPGGGGKISRGQRSKIKKLKEKYANQDEEERSIRMALLCSAGRVQKNDKDSQNGKATTEKGMTPAIGGGGVWGREEGTWLACKLGKKNRMGHLSRDCQERPDETVHGQSNCQLQENTANEMDKIAMDEDDIHEIGEEEKDKLTDVDYLTGNPLPNDILLYSVPVCGPYSALQSYKYRVKIVPGTAKKGKASTTLIFSPSYFSCSCKNGYELVQSHARGDKTEKELMKACTDPELVAALIGNVKITAAGLTQLKQKQKKGKKTNKEGS
ncbi:zinc knuckle (CCHC-type) family protein [Actinidia rufa]|uniref:Zinc knuckle (CCHC-type) family protein n=1 Tax=Actinidia rufa TaxID=165716 RepID=A0A7J0HEV6_9ERIC|nr:zinc knuckle (CCHC-type) family protein [Actinidia rufa]